MRRIVSFVLAFSLFCSLFCALNTVSVYGVSSETDSNMEELYTFESIVADNGGTFPIGSTQSSYDAADGVLTLPTASNTVLFVTDVVDAAYFTIHVEMSPTNLTSGFVIQDALLLGSSSEHHRFYIKDVVRTATQNRAAYARYAHHKNGSDISKTDDMLCDKAVFNAGEWVDIDVTVDKFNRKVYVSVNGAQEIVKTITDLDLSGQIGFYGKCVQFRNFSVSAKKELYSFESLESAGNVSLTGSDAVYADGVLTMTNAGNRSVLLTNASVDSLKRFTLHTEVQIPEYSATQVMEAGIGIGKDTGSLYRFIFKDDGKERNAGESIRSVYLQQYTTSGTEVTELGFNFIPGMWLAIDILVDVTQETASVYVNDRYVTEYPFSAEYIASGKVGFRGFNGVAFRDFRVTDGLIAPIAEGFTSTQVVLNEKLDMIFTARILESATDLCAKIYFNGTMIEVNDAELEISSDINGYKNVSFILSDICPQDICKTINVELYAGEVLLDSIEDYTIQTYCMKILPNKTSAGTDSGKIMLRKMLLALLNYGSAAQAYFTEDTNFANEGVAQNDFTHFDMSEAESVRAVDPTQNAQYYWKSATLALYNTVCLRYKFVAADINNVLVKATLGNTEVSYTAEDFTVLDANAGLYCIDFEQVFAHQFDETVIMELYVSSQKVQTVTYSVHSYVRAYADAGKVGSDEMDALIQAIYDYGCIAQTYGG